MFPPVTDRWLTSLVTLSFVCAAASALAEQGDRDKPIQIEADRASLDQLKGVTVYEGNVVVTQGTILLRAAQVTVTQDKNGGGDVAVARTTLAPRSSTAGAGDCAVRFSVSTVSRLVTSLAVGRPGA